MDVTRRTFLLTIGGTAAAAAAITGGTLARAKDARVDAGGEGEVERWSTGEESTALSICQQCPGGCGLVVRTVDGQAAGIAGNPLHPVNRGAVCPKAFGALQLLYDPDRIKRPMVRDGERGRFRSIGWDEAAAILVKRLADTRSRRGPEAVAILGGQYRGYRDTVWARFAEAYGTPNYLRARCLQPGAPALAHQLMQGVTSPLGYDLTNARCILSFGTGLLEAWLGPVHASLAFARLRTSGDRPRGRLIQVDPRRSQTAAKADRWIPIVPGTDGVLALGIANALMREGLYDEEFVRKHTFGFEDWVDEAGRAHQGFKSMVLADYGLVSVSTVTGVPVQTILETARDLAKNRPAVVIGERGTSFGPDDLHTRMAIHSLNALVGNIGTPGGLLLQGELPLASLPSVRQDETARRGRTHARLDGAGRGEYLLAPDAPQALPDRILSGVPYPIEVLLLFATNPLGSHPSRERFASAVERVPFVVSFSPFMDETTARADLILPDHTYLERWQDDQVTHLAGFTCFSLAGPAVAPVHATKNSADVVLGAARALGGSVGESLPWAKFEDLLRVGAEGLYRAGRGYVVSTHGEEALREVLERQGYWTPEFASYDEFWNALKTRGAWWDPTKLPVSPRALLRTESGRFEFYSTRLRRHVEVSGAADALGARKRGDLFYLPAVVAPATAKSADFPLQLSSYRLVTRPTGGGRNQPWLLEQPAVHVQATWERWIEVHPETAQAVGVNDGDWVWVESAKGRIKLRAKLYADTHPQVVHVPLFGQGPSPNDIIAPSADAFRGFGILNNTRVKVYRA